MPFPDAQLPAVIERAFLPALHYLFGVSAALAAGGALLMLVPGYFASRSMDPRWGRLAGRCAGWALALLLGAAFAAGAGAWLGELVLRPRAAERLAAAFGPALGAGGLLLLLGAAGLAVYASGWRRGLRGGPAHFGAGVLAAAGVWAGAAVLAVFQSFSLGPGRWLETRALRDALLHPSALPSLVLFASGAVVLGAAAGLLHASAQRDGPWRLSLVRVLGGWAAPAAWAGAAGTIWWVFSLPPGARDKSLPALAGAASLLLAGLGAYLYRACVREPRRLGPAGALLAALAALLAPALMQLAREEARGPFLIRGYMYRNGILVEEVEKLRREGFWRPAPWREEKNPPAAAELGALVFRGECAACHPGWQGGAAQAALPPFREEGAALRFLGGMEKGHPAFPAFAGSERERAAVAAHIEGLLRTSGVSLAVPPPPAPPKADERKRARPAPPKAEEKKETRPAPPAPPKAEEEKEARPAPPAVPPAAPAPAKEPAREAPKEAPKEALKAAPPKEAPKEKAAGAPPSAPPKPETAPKSPEPPSAPAGEKAAPPPAAPAPQAAKPPEPKLSEPRREDPKPPEPKRAEPKREEPRPGSSPQAAPPAPPAGSPRPAGEAGKKEAGPPAPAPSTPLPGGGGAGP